MITPNDAAVRQAAIDPRRSFLVQAPAGSGKTELLTDRILALLATVRRPEEVVAITFTKKAAAEMHARVLEKLQAGLSDTPPAEAYKQQSWALARQAIARDKELGWELLAYPARLSIRTIDSLCAHLVRAMPWVSGLGGMPAVAEDVSQHYLRAAQATLALIEEQEPVAQMMAHMDVHVPAAEELLMQMLASRDQWQHLLSDPESIFNIEENLEELLQVELTLLVSAMPLGWAQDLAPMVRYAAEQLQANGNDSLAVLQQWDGQYLPADVEALPLWRCLADFLLTAKGELRKTVTIKQGFAAKSAEKEAFLEWLGSVAVEAPWVSALARVRDLPNGYSVEQLDALMNFIQVLWLASFQLRKVFAEQSEVDFIEISQRALHALGSAEEPSELLLKADRAIQHLLVDEFQDTSLTQIALLERLSSGWEAGDGRTLFLVGDPMQSIYRFRKAEVGLFLRVKAEGALGSVNVEPLTLTTNFRSQAGLVQWVNRAGMWLFPAEDDSDLGAVSYSPSDPFNAESEHAAVNFHPVWSASDDEADAQKVALQSQQRVVALCQEALQRYAGSAHPVAILVRARSHLRQVVRELTMQGIPCRAVELEPLAHRPVVGDLVQLVRALCHPGDRLAWLAVLRSPMIGLRLRSLHTLCGSDAHTPIPELLAAVLNNADRSAAFEPNELQRLQIAAAALLAQRNRSGSQPFAGWLQEVWQQLGAERVYAHSADRDDAEQVFRLLENLAPYGDVSVEDFEARVERLFAVPQGAGECVEIMTIHKSKGLEFESVILYGLERAARGDTAPLIRLEHSNGRLLLGPVKPRGSEDQDPVSAFLAKREQQRAFHEANRLLYVAVTRARSQLHVVADMKLNDAGQFKEPSAQSLLGRIWGCLPVDEPEQVEREIQGSLVMGNAPRWLQRVQHIQPIAALPQPVSMAHNEWRWPESTQNESALGIVAHAWLERMASAPDQFTEAASITPYATTMRTQLLRAGTEPERVMQSLAILQQTLGATLASERGQWLLGVAKAYREWSLLDAGGRVSVIDLAISQEDHWLIVDYKTSAPTDGESVPAFEQRMLQRHSAQLQRYCEQVQALDGRQAKAALYFPRVDLWVPYSVS
ncbi:MAG: UvrD-helicase domain-containing protein [Paenalcaligenes sp.]